MRGAGRGGARRGAGAPAPAAPPREELPLRERILAALYQRGRVPRARLAALAGPAHLEAALEALAGERMLVSEGARLRLTRRGDREAYRLSGPETRPLAALLRDVGVELPAAGRLLDLGCGPGVHLGEAAARGGLQVVGVDRDADALDLAARALARAGRTASLVRADAERLPFAPGCFDGVVCAVVLPYVRDRAALEEAARVLAPGGRMVLSGHGPGYYLGLLAGRGMTLRRRLFALASLGATLADRGARLGLPGARFQSARRVARLLGRRGVAVARTAVRGRRFGLPEKIRIAAEKRP